MPLVIGATLLIVLYRTGRRSAAAICTRLRQTLADAEVYQKRCRGDAKEFYDRQRHRMAKRHRRELRKANSRHLLRTTEITGTRDAGLVATEESYHRQAADLLRKRDETLREANAKYPQLLQDLRRRFAEDQQAAQTRHDRLLEESRAKHEADWDALAAAWREGMTRLYDTLSRMDEESQRLFPEWNGAAWQEWKPPSVPPPGIRFGEFTVRLDQVHGGISKDARLKPLGPDVLPLPAMMPFPHQASLLIQAAGDGRQPAVQVLQSVMLRMLATIPPGKVRFTIIDPVGLGENFAGFMHLADFDDVLVTNRIWTEPGHIEARLADLTEQMENVIQKYLRNDFESIAEYNEFAGEVAEAFRILVVANFPVNFTETAARRLTSIAASGARCGVHVLMTTDTNQPLPLRFDLEDIARHSTNLAWNGETFTWKEPSFAPYPLAVEQPPGEERFTQIVQLVGENAKDSRRVEVPFEYIAPALDKWWQGSTAHGIDVPLGRAGATKLQHLRLGQGTSQHVLVAGKTGSGKSTLLHAMITNLALIYSPVEIELYLIDFKKGVEFKTYATHELPHARVIAIESEREFGLSVLQRLDAELRRRGDMFRDVGVQNLAGYRQEEPDKVLPRILLVVDEFQELFTEEDKIAQDAALMLDRLVRQGRAFGIHVLLGSQTLGGAYSLARSTIGQMAVRIALQCSENDAHLILSEDNSAARLLSRPGEAIYNDANGMMEGNNPFQIVWLSDARREEYLQKIHKLSTREKPRWETRQIVFEGNIPADIARNTLLDSLLHGDTWPEPTAQPHAWLGEAIAIKDPTAAVFVPQNGCNLLLIGLGVEERRAATAGTAMVSLAAQYLPAGRSPLNGRGVRGGRIPTLIRRRRPNRPPSFYVVDNSRSSKAAIGRRRLMSKLAALLPVILVRTAGRRELAGLIAELAQEVDRRMAADKADAPTIYLFIRDLARFRDLRREDEMGFSFSSEPRPVSPGRPAFADILREGPAVGAVHTIVWCDTLNNLNRAVDRQGIREFDLRVLFQMAAADSSQLIDNPQAGKLGPNLALFYNEEEGRLAKFRPYAWPTAEWLEWVRGQLHGRAATEAAGDKVAS